MTEALLIVEDDEDFRFLLEESFRAKGRTVVGVPSIRAARQALRTAPADILLLDLQLADGSGMDVLQDAREVTPDIVVVIMSAYADVHAAVDAMKQGAADLLVKPFQLEDVERCVERALEARDLRRKVRLLEREKQIRIETSEILGESPAIGQVCEGIRKVAGAPTPILILGETGTGKELVADQVHRLSPRAHGPLVKVNCSAFSEQLLESELFGHERGAFTDAREARAGLFEMAAGGTLFLDEVSELRLGLQGKLLRIVEGQPFRRLGGQRDLRTDVRVVAATNRDLAGMVRAGSFREDLYFRLNVFPLVVPPLRERGRDVLLLADEYLRRSAETLRKPRIRLEPKVEALLLAYDWPGNVRELKNVMERAAILEETEVLGASQLPAEIQAATFLRRHAPRDARLVPTLDDIQRLYILEVVARFQGNLSEAARALGASRNTLKARLRRAKGPSPAPTDEQKPEIERR
ncbi:MAG: sigma-54-dependent Fis family transcriptional regulator [Planctomycetes bacterium]|nr:sigma-54-dependent Fis family transcriptional regulator [Planctomycetota bacterium]